MNQRHFGRSVEKMRGFVARERSGSRADHPHAHAEIGVPGLAAELSPLDLERLLPPEILRLFVREHFLRKRIRVDGFQFRQRITSFSSSTPHDLCTRSRTSSINFNMSEQLALPVFTKKFACRSLTMASPTRWPFRPSSSIIRPAEPPAGFLKMQPALFWFSGWLARRFSLQTLMPAKISLNGFDGSSSFTRSMTSSGANDVCR